MSDYEDIIHLPHYRSQTRSHMSSQDRAAQFSPFAALTGFDSAIEETGRYTEFRPELLEYQTSQLDRMLLQLETLLPQKPHISVSCFVPDARKSGGHCILIEGHLKKIDRYGQILKLTDGRTISLADILRIESTDISDFP